MISELKRFLNLWNPTKFKYYIYYEPSVPGKDAITIVKSRTRFEAAYNSPGKYYFEGRYLDIDKVPDREQLDAESSFWKSLSRKLLP